MPEAHGMTKAAKRAVDSIAADILARTVIYGPERCEVLDAISAILTKRANELRTEREKDA